jgi:hypothetical protein
VKDPCPTAANVPCSAARDVWPGVGRGGCGGATTRDVSAAGRMGAVETDCADAELPAGGKNVVVRSRGKWAGGDFFQELGDGRSVFVCAR